VSERAPGADRARALYRRLLSLYPATFRARYGDDLLQAFDDRRTEPRFRGTLGGARLILFLLRDFMTSVPLAHDRRPGRGVGLIMTDLWQDLRFSTRMLVKNPMFTLAAIATLALGIGLNAATFSAVQGILLRPLEGTERPERLVQMYRQWPGIEFGSNSIPHYQDVRDRTREVFESVAGWIFQPMAIAGDGTSERTIGMLVSANFFQTYGVQPLLGRAFVPGVEDRDPGAHPVAVLGHGYWQTRFGADPSVVGRTISINGHPYEIVGVAPEDFRGPISFAAPPIYVPLMMQRRIDASRDLIASRGSNSMNVVGRLRDGQTLAQGQAILDAILMQLRDEYPESYDDQLGTRLVPQNEAGIHPSFGSAQMGMGTVMMVVVALLLLIACVNVANLFLARARDRRHEMGVRLSLGAGRPRIVRQLLTESLLFSALAGLAGLGLAALGTQMLGGFRPPIDGPWDMRIDMDSTVLLFTAVVSLGAGLVFGMAPALHAASPDTASAIKGESDRGRGRSRASSALVVIQISLSLLLLVTSGLFLRSLQSATDIDPGFEEPRSLATMAADPGLQGYDEATGRQFWDRMLEDVSSIPAVGSASLAWSLPLGLNSSDRGIEIPGYEFGPDERSSIAYTYVSEGYFETMGIDVVDGRVFTRSDDADAAPAIVVNRRFAERFWPGESAVGRLVGTAGEQREVVGVVETGKYGSLGEEAQDFMYLPYRELYQSAMIVVARTAGDPQPVMERIRALVRELDPDLPVYDVRTMEDHMGIALLPARLGGSVLGLFGLLGLTLAAVGIYGVMAYSVSQRKRELGIRVAMGADRPTVIKLVLGEGMKLALLGTVIGVAGALGAARLVQGLLYNVSPLDPIAFTGVPLMLVAVAALAVYLPARRAAAVDPMKALKTD
jgi:macrolide transport system ATP-binding/permease protein